uniref:Uncharacterized protein n=1 Tax=Romanomermis culicivorax TaxID=13658 RepID=A0A915JQ43_ROMCU
MKKQLKEKCKKNKRLSLLATDAWAQRKAMAALRRPSYRTACRRFHRRRYGHRQGRPLGRWSMNGMLLPISRRKTYYYCDDYRRRRRRLLTNFYAMSIFSAFDDQRRQQRRKIRHPYLYEKEGKFHCCEKKN